MLAAVLKEGGTGELERCGTSPISLVLCDIDYFKKVNDAFGNLAGDQVLI
jgi:diguanylate cyclase (GGDEF)-like protein